MSCFVVNLFTAMDCALEIANSPLWSAHRPSPESIATALLDMNTDVYGWRYAAHGVETECEQARLHTRAWINQIAPSNDPFQRLKSLDCLTYQLSEGYEPAAYCIAMLQTVRDALCASLIAGTDPAIRRHRAREIEDWPEYASAQWDRDPKRPQRAAARIDYQWEPFLPVEALQPGFRF